MCQTKNIKTKTKKKQTKSINHCIYGYINKLIKIINKKTIKVVLFLMALRKSSSKTTLCNLLRFLSVCHPFTINLFLKKKFKITICMLIFFFVHITFL